MTDDCLLDLTRPTQLSQSSKEALVEAYKKGVRVRVIAERFGVSKQRVSQIADKAGIPLRRRGFNAGRRKKTEQELYEAGRRKHLPAQLERARRRHLHLVREARRIGLEWMLDEVEKGYE